MINFVQQIQRLNKISQHATYQQNFSKSDEHPRSSVTMIRGSEWVAVFSHRCPSNRGWVHACISTLVTYSTHRDQPREHTYPQPLYPSVPQPICARSWCCSLCLRATCSSGGLVKSKTPCSLPRSAPGVVWLRVRHLTPCRDLLQGWYG